jgi:hypothetical protein
MSAAWKTTAMLAASAALLAAAGLVNHRLSPFYSPHQALATGIPAEAGTTNGSGPSAIPPSGGVFTPPPSVHFATVLLGGFRGVITDGLWIRSAMLQEQGRFLELIQIADWITALEPEFPQVWALQAWNMAYNISILMPDDENRWQWVRNGLQLLRDRAIPATGTAPAICLELGQLFLHKIGGPADDHADRYRQRWVMDVMQATGHHSPPGESDHAALQAALRMDPVLIRQIEGRYGRIDWRLPESQALYWAFTGLSRSPTPGTAVLCRRMIYQAMASLFEGGALTAEPDTGVMVFATAFDLLPGALRAYEDALPTDPVAPAAFAVFLRRAIGQLATFQRQAEAQSCFDILHRRFPDVQTQSGFAAFTRHARPLMPKIISTP